MIKFLKSQTHRNCVHRRIIKLVPFLRLCIKIKSIEKKNILNCNTVLVKWGSGCIYMDHKIRITVQDKINCIVEITDVLKIQFCACARSRVHYRNRTLRSSYCPVTTSFYKFDILFYLYLLETAKTGF